MYHIFFQYYRLLNAVPVRAELFHYLFRGRIDVYDEYETSDVARKVSVRGRHLPLSWVMVSCVNTRSNLPFAGVMFCRPFVSSYVEDLDPYDRHHLSHTITFHGI